MERRILPISLESDRTPPKAIRSTKIIIICCDIFAQPRHLCLNFACDIWLGNRYPNRYPIDTLIDTYQIVL